MLRDVIEPIVGNCHSRTKVDSETKVNISIQGPDVAAKQLFQHSTKEVRFARISSELNLH